MYANERERIADELVRFITNPIIYPMFAKLLSQPSKEARLKDLRAFIYSLYKDKSHIDLGKITKIVHKKLSTITVSNSSESSDDESITTT